jgi:glycosyltransferase involved in cell wall biosynthesis
MTKRVLIIQRILTHYRQPFFEGLRKALAKEGVELSLLYGKSAEGQDKKKDEIDIEWATYIPTKAIKIGPLELFWQPALPYLANKDLVIVEQANKNLINYYLTLRSKLRGKKFAYWGHGLNRQTNPNDLRNRFKRLFINSPDWWFAYTSQVKGFIAAQGYPAARITAVENAIDTSELLKHKAAITPETLAEKRKSLNLGPESKVGLYVGGMYAEKRIDFLLEAVIEIKKLVPEFHLVAVGSGADAGKFEAAAAKHDWIHYAGPQFGEEKVKYFLLSDVFLMPGLVGLAVVDTFALETPLITTDYPFHSPEIGYLEHGVNGLIAENTLPSFIHAVTSTLNQPEELDRLRQGCRASYPKYTMEQMVENFKNGILLSFKSIM